MSRRLRFTVEDPVFKTEPLFLVNYTPAQLAQELRRYRVHGPELDGFEGICLTFDRAPWRVVWTRERSLPVALHETFHLVTRICWDKDIAIRAQDEHGKPGDETAAYLFEFFARAVVRRLGRRT